MIFLAKFRLHITESCLDLHKIPQSFMAIIRCASCPFYLHISNNTEALAVVLKRKEIEN